MVRKLALILALIPLLLSLPAAQAEGIDLSGRDMPSEIKEYFAAAAFSGCTIGPNAAAKTENTAGGNYFFAVTTNAGHNVLHMFRQKDGLYRHVLRTESAVPQGRGFFSLHPVSGQLYLLNDSPLSVGDAIEILFTLEDEEEQGYASLFFAVNTNGVWNLKLACVDYLWTEVLADSHSLTYYCEGEKTGSAYGAVQTDLRYFSFSAFPKTLAEARKKLSGPPEIPDSAQLRAKTVKFTGGKKYDVYTGPGEKFFRAADGKAAVSTNDWIQVFGVEDGWAMIQYDLTSDQMRIGWIRATALPKNAAVDDLHFNDLPAIIAADTELTDDPLKSRAALRKLSQGQQVTWLATLGQWAYVQDDQNWIRGFVPLTAISQGEDVILTSQPVTGIGCLARGEARLSADKTAQITVTVSYAGSPAPDIQCYQLYADSTPIGTASLDGAASEADALIFRTDTAIPQNASVISLRPVYASGVRDEEAITIFVGP